MSMDEMYRACKYCHSYTGGKCRRGIAVADTGMAEEIYEVAESGMLSEALGEALGSANRKCFENELKLKLKTWGISEKRIKEFMGLFSACLDQFLDIQCKPICDDEVSVLYNRIPNDSEIEDVIIKDPDTFWCKYFT